VSYADPSLAVQKATIARLDADPVVFGITGGRVYDGVPPNAVKPYISFGPFQLLPEHGACLDGGEIFMTLDCWAAGPSTVQVKQLGAAVAASLDLAELVLDTPQLLVELTVEQIQYLRDPDGLTAHAAVTLHGWTTV
jgi:hypothetical protein